MNSSVNIYIAICFLLLLIGCSAKESNNKQSHPIFSTETESTELLVSQNKEDNRIEELANRFNSSSVIDEVDKNIVFGRISDIEFDVDSNIYLLDQDQVRVFKYNDSKIDTFGSKGRGPGEMIFPLGMDINHLGEIYVSDFRRGITRIKRKETNKYSTYAYSDIKKAKNGFYLRKAMIASPNPEGRLKTIDFIKNFSDSISYSFGKAYISKNRLAVRNYSSGLIEYVDHNNLLISINDHSPFLYAYKNGSEVWKRKISDFIPFEMVSTEIPLAIKYHKKFTEEGEIYDHVETIEVIEDEYVLLQILRGSSDDHGGRIGELNLRSYILDSNTGKAFRINDLPKIFSIHNSKFVALKKNNQSTLKLFSF